MSESSIQLVHNAVTLLLHGWDESIEYTVNFSGGVEHRVRTRHFEGLLDQLETASRMPASVMSGEGSNPNKSGSKPPVNQAPLNLIDDITQQAVEMRDMLAQFGSQAPRKRKPQLRRVLSELVMSMMSCAQIERYHPDTTLLVVKSSESWVRRARILLGFDMRTTTLESMVCGRCGGALSVAVDASTDVSCIGKPNAESCGMSYPRWSWVSMLES